MQPLANVLAEDLEIITGYRLKVKSRMGATVNPGDIVLGFRSIKGKFAETEAEENQAYRLLVDDHVTISSQYYKGVAYGVASLLQVIKTDSSKPTANKMLINDRAQASYRTVMLDVARQPHSLNALRDMINLARLYKLRYLHLHLTDDQNFTYPFEPVISGLKKNGVKNFNYSKQELVQLVKYADDRGVTLIPELDLPGHTTKLIKSGFLKDDPQTKGIGHADVASPLNYVQIEKIIEDMREVFASSPYFHVGGDESSAGHRLEPMLAHVNQFLRSSPPAQRKRMLVWEGFRGAPTESLPATGDDRVIVLSWEGGVYNPPWNLLRNGYSVVNSSWKPLYIVGGGNARLPHYSTRRWPAETIYGWDSDTFMHWQPGVPVYQDKGPNDPDRSDSNWKASYIGLEKQVIGGQMLFWEHSEKIIIRDGHERIPAFSDRLWNPTSKRSYADFRKIQNRLYDRVTTLLHPVEILPGSLEPNSPASLDYMVFKGDRVNLSLRNRSKIKGQIRYELGKVRRQIANFESAPLKFATVESPAYQDPVEVVRDGFSVTAGLFRQNGEPVRGQSFKIYNNFPQTVRYTTYRRDRDEFPAAQRNIPDFETFIGNREEIESGRLPWLRGNWTHTERALQRLDTMWRVKKGGLYKLEFKADSGRATIYVDLNQNEAWDDDEKLLSTLPREKRSSVELPLEPGDYHVRIDHVTELVRPVLTTTIDGPDSGNRRKDLSLFLVPLDSHGKDLSPRSRSAIKTNAKVN